MLKLVNLYQEYENNKFNDFYISSISKFSDNVWDFRNEKFVQKDKKTKYLINFDINVEGFNLLDKKYNNVTILLKSFIYYTLNDISYLTVRSYFHSFKNIFLYMATNKIYSFEDFKYEDIFKIRDFMFSKYGVGSIQAFNVFQVIKHITEKRKLLPFCYKDKFLKDIKPSQISCYKRNYNQTQTNVITDKDIKNIIIKCNKIIDNSEELIKLKKDYSSFFVNYQYFGENGEKGRKKMIRKSFLRKHPEIKSSVEFKNSIDEIMIACFVLISLYTGMRLGEVLSIPVDCIKKIETFNGKIKYDIFYIKGTTYKYADNKYGIQETNDIRSEWLANGEVNKAVLTLKELFNYEYSYKGVNKLFFSESNIDSFNNHIEQKAIIDKMKLFLSEFGDINHHQFRRTFARLVARSAFCDVDILKEHFKHRNVEITEYYMRGDIDNEFLELVEGDKNNIKKSILWDNLINKAKEDLGDKFDDLLKGE